jgi:hypothetical protein
MTQPRYEHLEVRPDDDLLDHGYSPRPLWAGTCPRCGAPAGTDCAVYSRKPGLSRVVGLWLFIAAVVLLAILAGALLLAVPAQAAVVVSGGGSGGLPDTATTVRGVASWYCGGGSACTRGYPPGTLAAAAGPALRVGDWRGRIVKVCSGGRCVRVQLVDWCACPHRVVDLYRSAFSRLASPSRGVLHVEVSWGGKASGGLPPTSTAS